MNSYRRFMFLGVLFLAGVSFGSQSLLAQEEGRKVTSPPVKQSAVIDSKRIPSLFFTFWQHQAIQEAKSSRGVVRPPTQAELDAMKNGDDEFKPKPTQRNISLGGIVYVKEGEWTIWLNGQRVTPDAVPPEVIDLQVFKDYIEIKWLDDFTDQVFPIRLRAHQRFNLDARIFLPG